MGLPSDEGASQASATAELRADTAALITGCWSTQVIHAAVRLGVLDRFGAEAVASHEIAAAAGAHPQATLRLLRALAILGLCRDLGGGRFELTPAGRLLRADAPDSLAALARHWGSRTWQALAHLEESVRTGSPWSRGGREGFTSMAQRPEEAAVLNQSMVEQTLQVAREIVEAYDFSPLREVIDVGGGYGALLSVVLERYPHLRGVSADLAYMAPEASAFLAARGLAHRARFLPVDFFETLPAGADAYLLKYIIHDWNDRDAVEILRNTRIAAGGHGAVLLIERLLPERIGSEPPDRARAEAAVVCGDINMMVATGGLERTQSEYRALLETAGLALARVIPTSGAFHILEAH